MTVRDLIVALAAHDMDARVVTNVWTVDADNEPATVEGDVTLVVKVSTGVALKGDELI